MRDGKVICQDYHGLAQGGSVTEIADEESSAEHERRISQTIADVTAELDRVARQIDTAVHETVNMSSAIMGSLQLLLNSLRRIADRLEQDLAEQDRRRRKP